MKVNVKSSNIVSFEYEANSLVVEFKGGNRYAYKDVPQSVFNDLINAESKGNYFSAHVKNNYQASKLK